MDVLTVVLAGALLALFTGIQTWINSGRFAAIDARFDRIDARFDRLDARIDRVDARIDRVESELAELRSLVMQLAVAMAPPKPQTG
ncbi:MAG: hypothetical protein LC663_02150 [Actinobacteria bacterium]|nr:hypothetical protein [Actinomycetota bacterium]